MIRRAVSDLAGKKQYSRPRNTGPKVKVTRDGPYVVRGGVPLSEQVIVRDSDGVPAQWRTGKEFPAEPEYTLCRCGLSENKPYCDGTHIGAGFDGTETAVNEPYLEQADLVEGPDLQLTDKEVLCSKAGFCSRAGGTRDLTGRSDDPEARREAVKQAGDCPSGRLVTWDKDGEAVEPRFQPSIGLVEDPGNGTSGPVWVRGDIPIEGADGAQYETRNRATLCRCGNSKNKPFCDGRHQSTR